MTREMNVKVGRSIFVQCNDCISIMFLSKINVSCMGNTNIYSLAVLYHEATDCI